jgi:hypothetical protein
MTDYIPRTSFQPRARSRALKCGDGGGGQRRCAADRLGTSAGTPEVGWCGGRDADSQSARGGPSRGVPMRHAAHSGNTVADASRSAVLQGIGRIPGTAINGNRSPGVSRSKPQTPRAERRGTGAFVVTTMPVYPLPFFVHRAMGRSAPRRSAHPRTLVRADAG